MTFSEFANLLFPRIGGNQSVSDFVIELVRNIMKEPVLKADKKLDEAGEYIPLPKEEDSLYRIFNGGRPISQGNARKILFHLDKERFELYIDAFPDDTLDLINSTLQGKGIAITDKKIGTVCADLFVSILDDCAKKKRKARRVPVSKQLLQAEQASIQVSDTQTTTRETGMSAEKEQSLQTENNIDDIDNTPLQEQTEIKLTLPEIDTSELEVEEPQLPELSDPRFYREYRQDDLKQFEIYAAWNPEPLDPELIKKWGSVRITDEFYKSIEGYGIEPFLAITPSDLLPMGKILTGGNVIIHIRNAVRFVEHMKPAMDHMLITKENQKIFLDISNFVVLLGWYLNFLIENSNNSDLFAPEFILMIPDDNKELKQKANEYYDELKSRLENLEKRLKVENERRPDNG